MHGRDVPRPAGLSHLNFSMDLPRTARPVLPSTIARQQEPGMRARSLRISWLAVALFPLGAAAVPPQELRIGAAVERPMAGGESHVYRIERIEAKPGTRLLVTVDQRGIDVVAEVR